MSEQTYEIGVSWNDDILEVVLSGEASEQNAGGIARDVITMACERRPRRLLVDCRTLTGRLGFADTYFLVREYPLEGAYITPRIAVVDTTANRNQAAFQETTTRNLGLNLRYFSSKDDAIEWLRA
jgi:hypothetical protein